MPSEYPVHFAVDYPDRALNRLTTAFRIFTAIPIVIVLGDRRRRPRAVGGGAGTAVATGAGVLFRRRC